MYTAWVRCILLPMRTKIRPIGNSRGIVIPSDMIERLGLEEGDEVDLSSDADRIIVRSGDVDRESFIESLERVMEEDADIISDLAEV